MKFQIPDELKERIEINLKAYSDLKNKLLSGDANTIRQIGMMSQKGINPKDVIEAYESNNMEYLYNQAKKMVEFKKIYEELCELYALHNTHKESDSLGER